jgi:hypothetical protein
MIDPPDTLLGRLQRGRGDAVRQLLGMADAAAQKTLMQCLCTSGDLCLHVEGYVELVLALSPDLSRWYRWIDALAADAPEDTRTYAFNTLGELARRGHDGAGRFLRRHVLEGCCWRDALSQFLVGVALDRDAWSQLLPRVDDETLALHVTPGDPLWAEVAAADARVERIVREQRERRQHRAAGAPVVAQQQVTGSWSEASYASAPLSHRRWHVLAALIEQDPAAAAPFLVDGLWDCSYLYRIRCVERCDLGREGVRERLVALASQRSSRTAPEAARRLASERRIGGS